MRTGMRCVLTRFVLVAALLLAAATASAESGPASPLVRVELLGESQSIAPGETVWVALRQEIRPGWHTYWMNPGDSGESPRLEWTLPAGFTAGEMRWPHPERIRVGPAMSYGYTDEVVLPIPVTAPADLRPGTRVTLRAQASWIVCEKTCVPEEAPVSLSLPVVAGPPAPDPRGAPLIAAARRAVPTPSPWPATFTATPERVSLDVAAPGLTAERVTEVWFYPARWGVIEHAAPQSARLSPEGITLAVARGPLPEAVAGPIDGVLVVTERLDGGLARHALSVRAEPRVAPAGSSSALLTAMALAFAGGLVLNLMPCVLPVLSVKALGLVHHAGERLRGHGLAYTAGVLVCFALVAGTLLALRAGGQQLGWGFQLQSPLVVTLLAYVLFVMALSLSGVIVLGAGLTGAGHSLAARAGYAGSFFTGALATVAATPCTAPFMGVAVGYALTQPWMAALLVFEALGLGLALPYLLLTLVPTWRRWLPRPGPWMTQLERFLAFPLYASVAWLVWVVSQQAGPAGVGVALGGLVAIALAAWLYQSTRGARALWRRAAIGAVLALAIGAVSAAALDPRSDTRGAATRETGGGWEPFSAARLAELRAAGTPVFVNVTAAWCLTCLVNERVALRSTTVTEALARKRIVRLKADWTTRDPVITRVLGAFGRSGVPLYLLYPAGAAGEPAVLPQILSERLVLDATERL
jgi:thiol:disulfide interchange protein/DsbC/DsbD-like thiol-disulfide interchange protein